MASRTPSETVAHRVREIRRKRDLTVVQLAERCAELDMPGLTAQAIFNIETTRPGRPQRPVSVDELIALAVALNVFPRDLLAPVNDGWPPGHGQSFTVAATGSIEVPRGEFRQWVSGERPLPDQDERLVYAELPPDEWRRALERRRSRKET
jgi:transcriptional regulator with XRE-family HTH domain